MDHLGSPQTSLLTVEPEAGYMAVQHPDISEEGTSTDSERVQTERLIMHDAIVHDLESVRRQRQLGRRAARSVFTVH